MKIFTSEQVRQADAYSIENEPIASVDLMERAATALADFFYNNFQPSDSLLLFAGPGNNGGDAWALARLLCERGFYNLQLYVLRIGDSLSKDSEINRERLMHQGIVKVGEIKTKSDFPKIMEEDWIVDGLFGSGLTRSLEGLPAQLVEYINESTKKGVVAIDIPSGLFGEDNTQNKGAVIKAEITLSFQFPKLAFFFSDNYPFVGNWHILPIGLHPGFIEKEKTPYYKMSIGYIKSLMKMPGKFSHKGTNGHGLLVAGCYGMMGAAILATRAAVHSGIGLVTAHIPRLGYEIMQISVPEALVSIDDSDLIFTDVSNLKKFSAIAIGPGLNCKSNTHKAIKKLLEDCNHPLLLDADALNILAEDQSLFSLLPENTILTPHPGEFDRLTKKHSSHYDRFQTQIELSKKYKVICVLKGAHTTISTPDGNVCFNTTGNPGMASGGSGDVLSGIILSLLAQGYESHAAAQIGVFIHGLSGDLYVSDHSEQSLSASGLIEYLGKAFKTISTYEL